MEGGSTRDHTALNKRTVVTVEGWKESTTMPPIRNQRFRHHQRAVRKPVKDVNEERDVEMPVVYIPFIVEAQDVDRDAVILDPQRHIRFRQIIILFMNLLNLLIRPILRVNAQ
ncbi:hypothetical protein K435DRAFT_782296 [Dendrothele bispora CBS 962.96]|uniref:Uncharacterized protein n=1 Tax=Dendrothele bispora (strain CBS 962.96) TaxID=1314807 RepID=A0A4S8LFQ2_DENBC|nr:hypothetical protein K435DRAFT_782296 [Dendrothele bispora CBS 962.96]